MNQNQTVIAILTLLLIAGLVCGGLLIAYLRVAEPARGLISVAQEYAPGGRLYRKSPDAWEKQLQDKIAALQKALVDLDENLVTPKKLVVARRLSIELLAVVDMTQSIRSELWEPHVDGFKS